jgi:hypothetical protein
MAELCTLVGSTPSEWISVVITTSSGPPLPVKMPVLLPVL